MAEVQVERRTKKGKPHMGRGISKENWQIKGEKKRVWKFIQGPKKLVWEGTRGGGPGGT